MKYLFATIISLLIITTTFAQKQQIYDKTDKYYAGINFDEIDTLSNWSYRLVMQPELLDEEPQQLGQLMIGRDKPLIDKSLKRDGGKWMPFIVFEIYDAKDYALCLEKAKPIRLLSSTTPPSIGGDMFQVGNFIFLNVAFCLNCMSHDTKREYCRPVVNAIFSKIDPDKAMSVEDIVKQFPIRKGK